MLRIRTNAIRIMPPEIIRTSPRGSASEPIWLDLEQLARLMDAAFRVPGTNIYFGLDAIIGLIPGLGDLLTTLVSLYILRAARDYGVPRVTLLRMTANIAIDSVVGSLPLVGDAFDVYWKANQKNVALLQRHLSAAPQEVRRARAGDWLFMAGLAVALLVLVVGSLAIGYFVVTGIGRLLFPTAT